MAKQKKAEEANAPAADEEEGLVVELVPQVGARRHPKLGEIKVPIGQFTVLITSPEIRATKPGRKFLEIAYVCEQEYAPINWLPLGNQFPADIQAGIELAVQHKLAALPNAHESDKQLAAAGKTRKVGKPLSEKVMNAKPPEGMSEGDVDTEGSAQNI